MSVRCSPTEAFDLIANVDGYAQWLPESSTYIRTRLDSDEVKTGATYTDFTTSGRMNGTIGACERPKEIEFLQERRLLGGRLAVRMHYAFESADDKTIIVRDYTITLPLLLRPLEFLVRGGLRRENERILAKIKAVLEG